MTIDAYLKSRCSHQLHREAWRAAFDALERGEACESTKLSLRIPAFGGFFGFAAPSHAIRDPPLSVVIIADALVIVGDAKLETTAGADLHGGSARAVARRFGELVKAAHRTGV